MWKNTSFYLLVIFFALSVYADPPSFIGCPDTIHLSLFDPLFFEDCSIDNPDDNDLTFRILEGPPLDDWWYLYLNELSSSISLLFWFTPTLEIAGEHPFVMSICDDYGACDTCSFIVSIPGDSTITGNRPPYFEYCIDTLLFTHGFSIIEGDIFDPDLDELDIRLIEFPEPYRAWWFDSCFYYPPHYDFESGYYLSIRDRPPWGDYRFTFVACDDEGLCDTCSFIVISPPDSTTPENRPPYSIACFYRLDYSIDDTLIENYYYDPDGDDISVEIIDYPDTYREWWHDSTFVDDSICGYRLQLFEPPAVGEYEFSYRCCDEHGLCDTCSFTINAIEVSPLNEPPVLYNCPDTVFMAIGEYTMMRDFSALDEEGDDMSAILLEHPVEEDWWDFDIIERPYHHMIRTDFLFLPEDVGLWDFAVEVCDFWGACDTCRFTVLVYSGEMPDNHPPVIYSCPDTFIYDPDGENIITSFAEDIDGDELSGMLIDFPLPYRGFWRDSIYMEAGVANLYLTIIDPPSGSFFYNFTYRVCDPDFLCDTCSFVLFVPELLEMETMLEYGWNIVSVPSPVPQYHRLFDLSVGMPKGFDTEGRAYYASDSLYGGHGYFILYPDTASIRIPTGLFSTNRPIMEGWNLIGVPGHPVPSTAYITTPTELIIPPIYGWDSGTQSYFAADTLYRGKGYWFLSRENGSILIGP